MFVYKSVEYRIGIHSEIICTIRTKCNRLGIGVANDNETAYRKAIEHLKASIVLRNG